MTSTLALSVTRHPFFVLFSFSIFPLFCLLPVHVPCVSDIQLNAVLLSSVDKNKKDFVSSSIGRSRKLRDGIFSWDERCQVFFSSENVSALLSNTRSILHIEFGSQ